MSPHAASGPAPPRRVAVVGAGVVGLATAWFLQDHGVEVTVLDRDGVAAGASWGNAGLILPSLAAPLPEPDVLRYGLRAALDPSSPVSVRPSLDPGLARFLTGFARHATSRRWARGLRALVPINRLSLESFDLLEAGGVASPTRAARPLLVAYRTPAEREALLTEIRHLEDAGQDVAFDLLSGDDTRALEPALSDAVGAAVRLHGQRFVDPGAYVHALARSVRERGGSIQAGVAVAAVNDTGTAARLTTGDGAGHGDDRYDAVVLATGAWLGRLARSFGVRQVIQAGRGYSFSVAADPLPGVPVYFPAARVACTPLGQRLRVAGIMEFRAPDAPPDTRRIAAVAAATRPLLRGADLDARHDAWVGPRPCTPDGLPLIGPTRSPRVFVAGGHGMWGLTLGPATGRLLAARIATGAQPPELHPFDPLR